MSTIIDGVYFKSAPNAVLICLVCSKGRDVYVNDPSNHTHKEG